MRCSILADKLARLKAAGARPHLLHHQPLRDEASRSTCRHRRSAAQTGTILEGGGATSRHKTLFQPHPSFDGTSCCNQGLIQRHRLGNHHLACTSGIRLGKRPLSRIINIDSEPHSEWGSASGMGVAGGRQHLAHALSTHSWAPQE